MTTTYNVGFPKKQVPLVLKAMDRAVAFIKARYPHIDFSQAKLNFSATRNRSMYYHDDGSINIRVKSKLYLYRKSTCGLTTPHGGLLVGIEVATACAIIHELTHYVQGLEKRKFSEVETTSNEIEFLKQTEPFWHSRLIKSNG